MFGSDSDDEEAAAALKAKQAEAFAKKEEARKIREAKAIANARSLIVWDVKPFDADTDLETLAGKIKAIKHEGIQNWGKEHKLEPVAYGVCKLVISCVVFDNKIGTDDIEDMFMDQFEDDIQSIDIAAMSKV